jgi:hypothetical protein
MPLRQTKTRLAARWLMLLGLLSAGPAAWGQDRTAKQPPVASQTDQGVTTASGVVVPDLEALRPGRAPLLREGSHLVDVAGHMAKDTATGQWRFHVSEENPDAPGYVLTMLPSALLGEMVAIVDSSPHVRVIFEATGEVFVYRSRNYLLPTHPPRLLRHEAPEGTPSPPSGEATPAGQGEKKPDRSGAAGDSVEDIMRKLDEAVGATAPPPTSSRDATVGGGDSQGNGGASRGVAGGGGRQENLMREGTAVLSRRGSLRRDRGGAWVFVFDSDATGLADPPLNLLPCLLLERIENYVRRTGDNVPVLMSGQVYVYEGRNYLMPSVYRIPRERTVLTPGVAAAEE